MAKINAIQNITEGDLIDGLGLDEGFSIHLSIEVIASNASSRVGALLFDKKMHRLMHLKMLMHQKKRSAH